MDFIVTDQTTTEHLKLKLALSLSRFTFLAVSQSESSVLPVYDARVKLLFFFFT